MPENDLRQRTVKGLAWSAAAQGGKQVSQLVITAALAWLLSPADFGLLAMAMVFTGFALIFGELGVSSALVQKEEVDDAHWSSAFWLNVFAGAVLTVMFIAAAPLIAAFYQRPELTPLVQAMALAFLFASLTTVQQTILTRQMDFRALMVRDIAAVWVSGLIGIVLAWRGYGVWSLVMQTVAYSVINSALLWWLSPWRPKLIFSRQAIADIYHFSANMAGFNIINYLGRNIDQLLVGRFLGADALGYYSLACKFMLLPVQNFAWMISRVMFPAFSRIQDDLKKMREGYLNIIKFMAILSFPVMAALAFLAGPIIALVYGPKWAVVAELITILAVCGAVQSMTSLIGSIYQASGRADIQFKYALFFGVPSVVVAVLLGLPFGIKGVAISMTVRALIAAGIGQSICNRLIDLDWGHYLKAQSKGAILTAATFIILFCAHTLIAGHWKGASAMAILGADALCFAGAYAVVLFFLRIPELQIGRLRHG